MENSLLIEKVKNGNIDSHCIFLELELLHASEDIGWIAEVIVGYRLI